jgi:hypothetical protein
MTKRNRLAAVLLLVTVILILLIAASIPDLELQPGQKYVSQSQNDSLRSSGRAFTGEGLFFSCACSLQSPL